MPQLRDDANDLIYEFYSERGIEPKDIDEDGRNEIIKTLFLEDLRFSGEEELQKYLGDSLSAYCRHLEDYDEYKGEFDIPSEDFQEFSPFDVMNWLWTCYGRTMDYDDLQARIDENKTAELTDEEDSL
jgi:hypothetical protein